MKRIIKTRRAGSFYILLSIFLGVIAVNSNNNLLYLTTAVLLGYMLASGLAGRANIRNASVTLIFPEEIYAQIPCAVGIQVTCKSRRTPLFLIEVGLEGERAFFPVVQPGETETKTVFIAFPERGHRTVDDIELSSVYPFNFFIRYWPVDFSKTLTVFPHPLRCEPEAVFIRQERPKEGGDAASPLSETDIMGVRAYQEGDSMKRIHWKSSARTGKLKTRLYDGTASQSGRIIDLDRLLQDNVERALSMASFTVAESLKSGLTIGMRHRQELILPASDTPHKLALLSKLALYGK